MRRNLATLLITFAAATAASAADEGRPDARAPIQEPITGREDLGDLSRPAQALAQFYRAVNTRDPEMMSRNWDQSGEAVMDNPVGGITRGWPAIRGVYERIFRGKAEFGFEFYDYTLHEAGDVFYVAGRERGWYKVGGERIDLAIRTTRVFRKIDGRWRQVHHHGSIDDPAMLRAYQKAVLGK